MQAITIKSEILQTKYYFLGNFIEEKKAEAFKENTEGFKKIMQENRITELKNLWEKLFNYWDEVEQWEYMKEIEVPAEDMIKEQKKVLKYEKEYNEELKNIFNIKNTFEPSEDFFKALARLTF